MKICNFRNFVIENEVAYAEVDVTEGYWIWKKTRTEIVFNNHIINGKVYGFWKWISTGRYTPDSTIERMYDKYKAEQILHSK